MRSGTLTGKEKENCERMEQKYVFDGKALRSTGSGHDFLPAHRTCRRRPGRPTALFRLAREALEAGLRVIITTTTHMKMERGIPLLVDAQPEAVAEALTQSPIVMTGCRDPKNPEKISGVSEEMLQAYEKLANLVLVEADGAKRLPLKAPAGWEPVLPGRFDVVIGVAGVVAVGKPFVVICFRPELAAGLLGKNVSDVVVPADLAELLCHAGGAKKSVTGSYRILLNKADGEKAIACAREVLARIAGREKAAVASLKEKMVVVLLAAGNSTRFHGNKRCIRWMESRCICIRWRWCGSCLWRFLR